MARRNLVFMMIGLGLIACSSPVTQTSPPQSARTITETDIQHVKAREAASLLDARPEITVLDIRTPREYAQGHIESARLIDFYDADFAVKLSELDRAAPYLVHCRSGGRSTKSLTTFRELGFTNVIHLDGGFIGWEQAGLAVTR